MNLKKVHRKGASSAGCTFFIETLPMTLIQDIINIIEEIAPSAWAEKWDNAGLQIGSLRQPVSAVFVAVDPTASILERAIKSNAQLIITHHPLFFHPLRQLSLETSTGKIITRAIRKNISIYSAHTNLDMAPDGVSNALIERLALKDIHILKEEETPPPPHNKLVPLGYGCIGTFKTPITFKQFITKIKTDLQLPYLQMAGKAPARVRKVAVCGGSGSQFIEKAYKSGANLYITAELKHSHARMAEELNFCALDIGHFHSEKFGMMALARLIRKRLEKQDLKVDIIEDRTEKSPLQLIK